MLRRLLEALEQTGGVVTVAELSRRTGIERGAVRQMLEVLADQGWLDRFGANCSASVATCRGCALVDFCGPSRLRAYTVPRSRAPGDQTA